MLTRLALGASLPVFMVLGMAPTAAAEDSVSCPGFGECFVTVVTPGEPAKPGSEPDASTQPLNEGATEPSEPRCEDPLGLAVECFYPEFGWWNPADRCHWRLLEPQPPKTHRAWEGQTDGAIYSVVCMSVPGTGGGYTWSADPPAGFGGGGPSPAEVAMRAVEQLPLAVPQIGMTPYAGKTGLVGLPIWLWLEGDSWEVVSATASVPGLSVTATATPSRVVWDMGDGTVLTCYSAGIPYDESYGGEMSPECGHMYERPSAGQPDDAYPVTATTTWDVTWSGGGESGQLTQERSSTTSARIGELQVLVS